ncbi:hypothetical protein PYCCODRAFT_172361 [Trametes coccinea BRFM310]|uniref:Uncharacterized protein n=1 Tax=Trametes coccinea (strain BRFM310) TaxID=1353009 RepID=A0A1Y2IVR9_TRAC3|nr:hypothetical protein PYCCODRAFT_172361 [Trametes coccinea BRFM310]
MVLAELEPREIASGCVWGNCPRMVVLVRCRLAWALRRRSDILVASSFAYTTCALAYNVAIGSQSNLTQLPQDLDGIWAFTVWAQACPSLRPLHSSDGIVPMLLALWPCTYKPVDSKELRMLRPLYVSPRQLYNKGDV